MTDHRRRAPTDRRTEQVQVMVTPAELEAMRIDAARHAEGNVSAMLRAAWRVWRGRQARTS